MRIVRFTTSALPYDWFSTRGAATACQRAGFMVYNRRRGLSFHRHWPSQRCFAVCTNVDGQPPPIWTRSQVTPLINPWSAARPHSSIERAHSEPQKDRACVWMDGWMDERVHPTHTNAPETKTPSESTAPSDRDTFGSLLVLRLADIVERRPFVSFRLQSGSQIFTILPQNRGTDKQTDIAGEAANQVVGPRRDDLLAFAHSRHVASCRICL